MLLWRSSIRYLLRHPWLMALSVLGVALGVALVVSIDLANASADRAFRLSAESVTGKATHHVVGGAGGLGEAVYRDLRVELGLREIAPVVEGYAAAPAGRVFQVLGVDPFAEAPFRSYVTGESDLDLGAFVGRTDTGILAASTADALGLAVGDTVRVSVAGVDRVITLVGVLRPADDRSAEAVENLMLVDIGTAQAMFGLQGTLSRVDLQVPDGPPGEAFLDRIRAALPPGADIVRSTSRTETVEQMTRAFELNLNALSLLALMVGMFLVYNTMTFSVVQRRSLLGRLRTLGVTRRQVRRLVLGEALVVGLVGTLLGLLLGFVLGQGLVRLVTRTINDLYYVVSVRQLALEPLTLAKGLALGIGATVLAAYAPAREAASAPPGTVLQRSSEETRARERAPRLAGAGGVLCGLGGVLLLLPGRSIVVSYGALFLILLGFALLVPWLVVGMATGVRPLMGRLFGLLGRMAARGIVVALSRTAVAIAALTIAVSATIGVGVMVASFRQTVVVWLDRSLQADVYISPPGLVLRRNDAALDPDLVARFRNVEGVASGGTGRTLRVRSDIGTIDLFTFERTGRTEASFRFKRGDPDAVWAAFLRERALILSEPLAYRFGLDVGDSLRVETDRGPHAFRIAGVFYDYGSDLGVAMMSRPAFEHYYDDRTVSSMVLYLEEGADLEAVLAALRRQIPAGQEVFIRSNQTLRQASLEVFDRTFTITVVLRLLAVGVAFIGVLSALMALQLERVRELAVLRVSGMTPRQLRRYVMLQTGLMGVFAGVLAVPLGLVLASVLIYVINKRSFGWTMQFDLSPEVLVQAVVLAVVAAVLAGLYPAWRMARANPAVALREE